MKVVKRVGRGKRERTLQDRRVKGRVKVEQREEKIRKRGRRAMEKNGGEKINNHRKSESKRKEKSDELERG